jgi:hypothetical protein
MARLPRLLIIVEKSFSEDIWSNDAVGSSRTNIHLGSSAVIAAAQTNFF